MSTFEDPWQNPPPSSNPTHHNHKNNNNNNHQNAKPNDHAVELMQQMLISNLKITALGISPM